MATIQIKQLKDKDEDFFPVTHERAVRDDDGNTLESKLAALDDGAVRTDVAQSLTDTQKAQALANLGISGIDDEPTAGSEKLVKSGGVYNKTIQVEKQDIFKKYLYAYVSNLGKLLFGINCSGEVIIPVIETIIKTRHIENKAVTPEKIDMGDSISNTQNKPVPGSIIDSFIKSVSVIKGAVADKKYIFSIIDNNNRLLLGIDQIGKVAIPALSSYNALFEEFGKSLHIAKNKKYIFAISDNSDKILFGITKAGTISSVSLDYIINYVNNKIDDISIETIDTEGSTWLDRTELLLNKEDNSNKNLSKSTSGNSDNTNNSMYVEALVDKKGFPVYAIDKDGNFIISKLTLIDESTGTLYNVSVNNGNISVTQKN